MVDGNHHARPPRVTIGSHPARNIDGKEGSPLDGGHTYRSLGGGNGVPKSSCRTLVHECVKVLARRAPLTEVVCVAHKAGWEYLIADGPTSPPNVSPPATPQAALVLRCIGEHANAQLECWQALTCDFHRHFRGQ